MIPFVVLIFVVFILYLGIRSFMQKSRLKVEISKEKQKMSVGYDQAFEWNAAIDGEKGVASGSVKIGKFSKPGFWGASLLLAGAVICLLIPGITVIGIILFSISCYTYYKWFNGLNVREKIHHAKEQGEAAMHKAVDLGKEITGQGQRGQGEQTP